MLLLSGNSSYFTYTQFIRLTLIVAQQREGAMTSTRTINEEELDAQILEYANKFTSEAYNLNPKDPDFIEKCVTLISALREFEKFLEIKDSKDGNKLVSKGYIDKDSVDKLAAFQEIITKNIGLIRKTISTANEVLMDVSISEDYKQKYGFGRNKFDELKSAVDSLSYRIPAARKEAKAEEKVAVSQAGLFRQPSSADEAKKSTPQQSWVNYGAWLQELKQQYIEKDKDKYLQLIDTYISFEKKTREEFIPAKMLITVSNEDKEATQEREKNISKYETLMKEKIESDFLARAQASTDFLRYGFANRGRFEDLNDTAKKEVLTSFIQGILNQTPDDHALLRSLALRLQKDKVNGFTEVKVVDFNTPLQQLKKQYAKKFFGGHTNDINELIKEETKLDATPQSVNKKIENAFIAVMNAHYNKHRSDYENKKKNIFLPTTEKELMKHYIENVLNAKPDDYSYPRALGLILMHEGVPGFAKVLSKEEIQQDKENAPRSKR
jgi:hypothetical protein